VRPGAPPAGPAASAPQSVPGWVPRSSVAVCLSALVAAGYLTWEHYTSASTFACPATGAIDCVKVTTSSYSNILGVPVAPLGLLYFAVLTLMCLPAAWASPRLFLRPLRLASVSAGVLLVLYLIWAELFRIDAICLWCTAVHILTIALFTIVVMAHALSGPQRKHQT
jgi:uncharacterized membrane protein